MAMRVTLAASLEAVSQLTQNLEAHLSHLPVEVRTPLTLAVQELLVNIVRHAYHGAEGQIDFEMTQSAAEISFQVTDSAENSFVMPDEVPAPDPLDLPESGLGLYIIQQAFDKVEYKRLPKGHCWLLVRTLGD